MPEDLLIVHNEELYQLSLVCGIQQVAGDGSRHWLALDRQGSRTAPSPNTMPRLLADILLSSNCAATLGTARAEGSGHRVSDYWSLGRTCKAGASGDLLKSWGKRFWSLFAYQQPQAWRWGSRVRHPKSGVVLSFRAQKIHMKVRSHVRGQWSRCLWGKQYLSLRSEVTC